MGCALMVLLFVGGATRTARRRRRVVCLWGCPRVGVIRVGCALMVLLFVGGATRTARRRRRTPRPPVCRSQCSTRLAGRSTVVMIVGGTSRTGWGTRCWPPLRCLDTAAINAWWVLMVVWCVGGPMRWVRRMRRGGGSPRCPRVGGSRAGCVSRRSLSVGVVVRGSSRTRMVCCGTDGGRADSPARSGGVCGGRGAGFGAPGAAPVARRGRVWGGRVGVAERGVRFARRWRRSGDGGVCGAKRARGCRAGPIGRRRWSDRGGDPAASRDRRANPIRRGRRRGSGGSARGVAGSRR